MCIWCALLYDGVMLNPSELDRSFASASADFTRTGTTDANFDHPPYPSAPARRIEHPRGRYHEALYVVRSRIQGTEDGRIGSAILLGGTSGRLLDCGAPLDDAGGRETGLLA